MAGLICQLVGVNHLYSQHLLEDEKGPVDGRMALPNRGSQATNLDTHSGSSRQVKRSKRNLLFLDDW
jgi:hypothetical protein